MFTFRFNVHYRPKLKKINNVLLFLYLSEFKQKISQAVHDSLVNMLHRPNNKEEKQKNLISDRTWIAHTSRSIDQRLRPLK